MMRWLALAVLTASMAGCLAADEGPAAIDPQDAIHVTPVEALGPAEPTDAAQDAREEGADASKEDGGEIAPDDARPDGDDAVAAPTPAAREIPLVTAGVRLAMDADCAMACQPLEFQLERPAEAWPGGEGWLEVRLDWDGTEASGFHATLMRNGEPVATSTRGFDAARIMHWGPTDGTYTLSVEGDGAFTGWIGLQARGARVLPGEDRLPNLVTMIPRVEGIKPCHTEESVEQGAQKCLRIGNAIGNLGDGPLEVHLGVVEGAAGATGLTHFFQRVYQEQGYRDVEAGPAEVHLVHGHFHYDGLAHFALYDYDEETGVRGGELTRSDKQGFCFLDWGRMIEREAVPEEEEHAEQDCLVPRIPNGWSMGISVGWYDYYWADLADQYIDVAGIPDGTYELVTIADGAGTLLETKEDDNSASVLVRIAGDQVDVLEERGFYVIPDDA